METSRRELFADASSAAAFVAGASALWVFGGMPAPGLTAVWLGLLCTLLARVEFRVGQGSCLPVMLAIVPMLVLLPAPVVPFVIAAVQLAARVPGMVRRGVRGWRLGLPMADALYSLAPALLLTVLGDGATVTFIACAVLILSDLVCWPLFMWAGTGTFPRAELRASVWIYLFDALLVPIGFAIALAAREVPAAPLAILPLAGLLAFFARERRTRDAHAATLQTILQHASDLILIAGRDGRLRSVMGASETLFGDDRSDGTLFDRVHPDDLDVVTRFLASAPGEAEFRLRHGERHVHAVAADLTHDPHVRGLVLTIRDDEARQALRHRASHDPLTGLANRALLHERIACCEGEVALLYLDLDGFKPINDRLGHAAGDEVLRLVARRLEGCVRSGDTVARLGGDEFALLVGDAAEEVAERVRAAFSDPFTVEGEALEVGASVGIAVGAPDAETLLAAADAQMYVVKRARR